MLVGRVCYLATHYVALEEIVCTVLCLEFGITWRQASRSLDVGIHLVVQAAFELCTLTCQFLRVERYILKACRRC